MIVSRWAGESSGRLTAYIVVNRPLDPGRVASAVECGRLARGGEGSCATTGSTHSYKPAVRRDLTAGSPGSRATKAAAKCGPTAPTFHSPSTGSAAANLAPR